jgi:hypothetical protein
MLTFRATCARDSRRFARNFRKCEPMAPAFPSAAGRTRFSRRINSTIAAAFSPRTFLKNRARFSSFTSSAV